MNCLCPAAMRSKTPGGLRLSAPKTALLWLSTSCLLSAQPGPLAADSGPLPPPTSPIALFRQLLNTNAAGRAEVLGHRPEAQRQMLEAKILEYEALTPELREERLQATEFRWYLRPLLRLSPSDRSEYLAAVPAPYRELMLKRLARWDALPDAVRKDLLAYDRALSWLAQSRLTLRPRPSAPAVPPLPRTQQNPELERQLAQWRALPESHRDNLCAQFESFFDMPASSRERALRDLSEEERLEIQSTLQAFAQLPPAQRALCIRSFRKFTQLTPAERDNFLRTAERWREMTPEERSEWRRLVTQLPPLPPGFQTPPPLPPPLPPLRGSLAESEKER